MKNLNSLYKKYLEMQGPGQNMADGGKVEDEDSVLSNLADSFKKAFSTPQPSPTPDPTLQDKYKKIRQQNTKNWEDPKNQAFAEGGEVNPSPTPNPQTREEREIEAEEVSKCEDDKKFEDNEEKKALETGLANGGKVGHNLDNLKQLKAAFDKFLSEEGKEKKMSEGGSVPQPSPTPNDLDKLNTPIVIVSPTTSTKHIGNYFAEGGQVGMGDVQKADESSRLLPTLDQGYSSPEEDSLAQQMQSGRQNLAKYGIPQTNVSPQDVSNAQQAQGIALGSIGKMAPVEEYLGGIRPDASLSLKLKKLFTLPQGSEAHTNLSRDMMEDLSLHSENGKPYVLVKDPNSQRLMQLSTEDGSLQEHKYSSGGKVNISAPNNGKTGEYTDFDLYKKYLKMKEPGFVDGGSISKYANDPNYQAWRSANPNVPTVVADSAYENFMDKGGGSPTAFPIAAVPSVPTQMPQNLGNPVINPVKAQQLAQSFSDGGKAEEVPVDIEEPSVIVGDTPMKEADAEEPEDSNDKALEEEMANEDFSAGENADESDPNREVASEDSDELENNPKENSPDVRQLEGMTLDHNEALKENPESKDQAAELQVSPDITKAVESVKSQPSDLEKAQKERDFNVLNQEVAKYGALAGAGMLGKSGINVNPAEVLKTIGSNDQYANLPVQKYEEQIANQQNDPKSAMSQTVRNYLGAKGFKVPDNASASDLFKVAPYLQKDQALQQGIQKVVMQQMGAGQRAELSAKTKAEIADKNRDAAMEREKLANQGRLSAAKASQETKLANAEKTAEQKAEQAMSSTRGKQAVMMAQRNLVSIQNAQKMLDEFPDTNKWTPSQVNLFNTEVGKIASGGVPTEGQMNELSNPTLASHMAKYVQQLANVPIGAEQGKFIDLNKKYLGGLNDVAHGIIRDNVGNTAKSYQNSLNPDAYKNMIYRHSDMLGLFNPAQERGISAVMNAKGLSRQDAIKALVNQGVLKDVNY